jgi:hypothetical protein
MVEFVMVLMGVLEVVLAQMELIHKLPDQVLQVKVTLVVMLTGMALMDMVQAAEEVKVLLEVLVLALAVLAAMVAQV